MLKKMIPHLGITLISLNFITIPSFAGKHYYPWNNNQANLTITQARGYAVDLNKAFKSEIKRKIYQEHFPENRSNHQSKKSQTLNLLETIPSESVAYFSKLEEDHTFTDMNRTIIKAHPLPQATRRMVRLEIYSIITNQFKAFGKIAKKNDEYQFIPYGKNQKTYDLKIQKNSQNEITLTLPKTQQRIRFSNEFNTQATDRKNKRQTFLHQFNGRWKRVLPGASGSESNEKVPIAGKKALTIENQDDLIHPLLQMTFSVHHQIAINDGTFHSKFRMNPALKTIRFNRIERTNGQKDFTTYRFDFTQKNGDTFLMLTPILPIKEKSTRLEYQAPVLFMKTY